MATTISDGTTTIAPITITGYDVKSASQNVFHTVIGRSDPDVTLRPAAPRTGTLTMLFDDELEAALAETLLRTSSNVFALADDDLSTIGLSFVASGSIGRSLDDQTRLLWTVTVDFQEVTS